MKPSIEVAEAVDEYMTENGFTREEYTAKTMTLFAGPFSFRVPNPKARQQLVPLHDIHHVVTGFGTDVIGEGEQGVWELRAGCPMGIGYFLNSLATAGAFLLSPRRVIRAFLSAKDAETLYGSRINQEAAQAMTLGELRKRLGVPENGVANRAQRRLHSHAPKMRFADRAAN
ncbi:MAG: hypothetical protein ABI461_01830 [Polyangiaceae bacterium]